MWCILGLLAVAFLGLFIYLQREPSAVVSEPLQVTETDNIMGALEIGQKFLEENKNKEGITTTESGLQYEVLTSVDTGVQPTLASAVEVHYHGTTIDGEVFDSSVVRGEKISFPLGGVIEGWQEGLQLMKVGEKYKFYIPSEIAYGAYSPSPAIPANSTLIFEVELFGVQ